MLHFVFAPTAPQMRQTRLARIAAIVTAWWCRHQRNRRQKATIRLLGGLDDRTLKDIGLHRSEIESAFAPHADDRRIRHADLDGWPPH